VELTKKRLRTGNKKIVSRVEALVIMMASAAAAVVTTVATVSGIVGTFTGPVTLTLPLRSSPQHPTGLGMDAVARFSAMEATLPSVPSGEAALLAWAGVLYQVSFIAVAGLLFLLAFRLRRENLFTPASAWIVGASGVVLALSASAAQALDTAARSRLAELIGASQEAAGETLLFVSNFNVAPLFAGIALVLVAGIFQFGRGLQEDTEGLV
jgi:hypothetical protein